MKTKSQTLILVTMTLVLLTASTGWAGIDYGPWLTGVTQNAVTVRWASPDAVGTLEYGTTESLGLEVNSVFANNVHQVNLVSLEAGTRYYYQVSSGSDTSTIHSFVTAPAAETPFHFAVISDTQVNQSVYQSIMDLVLPTKPAFVLHNGDLVEYPFMESLWADFWEVTDQLAGDAPYFPVRGNHEKLPGGYDHFVLYWTTPLSAGTVSPSTYAYQYGNTVFINLDIGEPYFAGSDQYNWLKQQLQAAKEDPSVKHCIVHAHYPPYSCSSHGDDNNVLAFREAVVPLFEQYDIDLCISGHDHNYQRSVVNGITYLVAGCSSGRTRGYGCDPQEWTALCEKGNNFAYIEIEGTEIRVEARRIDGTVIESFTIDHDYHGGEVDDDTSPDDDATDDDDAGDDDALDDDAADDDTTADDDNDDDDDEGICG